MAESSHGNRRSRRRIWTELPDELTAAIFSRLGAIDIIESAQKVCMKWRRVSKDPLLWRRIDMCNDIDIDDLDFDLEKLFSHAVDRSRGNVVDINIEYFGTDELLISIATSARDIRRLRLYSCDEISDYGLNRMAPELRLLEEVDISLCRGISPEGLKVVGRSCPLLKTFKLNKEWCRFSDDESDSEEDYPLSDDDDDESDSEEDYPLSDDDDDNDDDESHFEEDHPSDDDDDYERDPVARVPLGKNVDADALAIAGTMHGLHHLQLYGNKLTDDGLRKIIDSCLHLESLDLRRCSNLNMGIELETRCVERIKKLWLPHDSTKAKGFTARSDGYCFKWLELPDCITASILSRLGTIDILKNARKVCRKWRKICKELKWDTLNMRNNSAPSTPSYLEKMLHYVVDCSSGNLVDVNVEDFITDEHLMYITNSSRGIKCLRLVCSYDISDDGLIEVAPNLPLLEDLDITLCENLSYKPLKVLGNSCPLLKSFRFNSKWHKYSDDFYAQIIDDEGSWSKDHEALAVAGSMHGLHHLQLFGNQLTNDGLKAILDGCPHLESLDLRHCFNLNLEGDLGRRCSKQIKKLLLPKDSVADYGFTPSTDWDSSGSQDIACYF